MASAEVTLPLSLWTLADQALTWTASGLSLPTKAQLLLSLSLPPSPSLWLQAEASGTFDPW